MLIALTTFLLVLGIILGTYWMLVVRHEDTSQRALRKRLRVGKKSAVNPELLRRGAASQ